MGQTPDRRPGICQEEGIKWEEFVADPTEELTQQYIQDKGLVILEDGVLRGIGESRENTYQYPIDDRNINTPPGTPSTGYRVIIGDTPTGVFVGHAGEIAQWTSTAWVFTSPKEGMIAYVKNESVSYTQISSSSPWSWSNTAGLTEAQHKALRHLIHLADGDGPFDTFSTSPYWEPKSGSGPWDHGGVWWESSSKLKKIVEKTINRNANKTPSTIVWISYDTDGSSALVTATDTFAYTGVLTTSVTRTFA